MSEKDIALYDDHQGVQEEPAVESVDYLTTNIDLTKVADAIRSRTGKTAAISYPDGYVSEISKLSDTSTDTVTADKMVSGVTAHDNSGKQITGTMGPLTQLAYQNKPVTRSNSLFIFPCSNSNDERCYLEGENSMDVSVGINVMKFGEASPAEVLKGKTFSSNSGIAQTGTYVPLDTSDATSTASDIANGKTAYVKGAKVTGKLPNYEAGYNFSAIASTMSYIRSSKLVSLTWKISNSLVFREGVNIFTLFDAAKLGSTDASKVLAGETFGSVNGIKLTGTMPNNGAAAIRLSDLTAKSVTAGYYSGGTAKIADAEAAKIIPENIKKGVTILGVEGTMEEGGPYNIAATTNSDGTQNLAITDAGGGSSGGGSGVTWVLMKGGV